MVKYIKKYSLSPTMFSGNIADAADGGQGSNAEEIAFFKITIRDYFIETDEEFTILRNFVNDLVPGTWSGL